MSFMDSETLWQLPISVQQISDLVNPKLICDSCHADMSNVVRKYMAPRRPTSELPQHLAFPSSREVIYSQK